MERRPLSLAAIAAGVVVTALLQVLLLMLGAAIGLTAFSTFEQTRDTTEIGYGVYLVASLLVSVFSGALVAAVASRSPFRGDGLLHGLVVWAALGLLSLFLLGKNADTVMGGALRLVRHTVAMEAPASAPTGGQVVDEVKQTVARASQGLAIVNAAEETRQNIAIGLWSFLGVEVLLLLAALAGGAAGTRGERRFRRRVAAAPVAPLVPQAS